MHRSHHMYRSHHTHRSHRIHACIDRITRIAYMHASISSHVSHALIASHTCMHRSHHMCRSHHMHRSHRIHACIDRSAYMHASIASHTCMHRSHHMYRSHCIHACIDPINVSIESHDRITRIDRIACVDHIIYTIATHACMHRSRHMHRSHNLTSIA